MKKQGIKTHLNEYSIYNKRVTTINHAFASAIAENDDYNETKIDEALRILGQDPNGNLSCFYCDDPAETWDHIYGLVKKGEYSGYGHVVGNLVPCCKKCNSEKGNQNWQNFLQKKISDTKQREHKVEILKKYLASFIQKPCNYGEIKKICKAKTTRYENIRKKITEHMIEADKIAKEIREKLKKHNT